MTNVLHQIKTDKTHISKERRDFFAGGIMFHRNKNKKQEQSLTQHVYFLCVSFMSFKNRFFEKMIPTSAFQLVFDFNLVFFISSRVPLGGFSHLSGTSGPHQFCIARVELKQDLLPSASTW